MSNLQPETLKPKNNQTCAQSSGAHSIYTSMTQHDQMSNDQWDIFSFHPFAKKKKENEKFHQNAALNFVINSEHTICDRLGLFKVKNSS